MKKSVPPCRSNCNPLHFGFMLLKKAHPPASFPPQSNGTPFKRRSRTAAVGDLCLQGLAPITEVSSLRRSSQQDLGKTQPPKHPTAEALLNLFLSLLVSHRATTRTAEPPSRLCLCADLIRPIPACCLLRSQRKLQGFLRPSAPELIVLGSIACSLTA